MSNVEWLALVAVAMLAAVYIVRCVVRRDLQIVLFAYLSFWLVVIVGGVYGKFREAIVLSRVSQQFSFLHPVVYLALCQSLRSPGRMKAAILLPALLLAGLYPFKVIYDFEKISLIEQPSRISHYRKRSFLEREEIGRLVGDSPVFLTSIVPSYTSLANIAALFSNVRLAVPPEYLRFFFLPQDRLPEKYRCAPYAMMPAFYQDIDEPGEDRAVYRGTEFRVYRNDLIPLFDSETFPIKHGFDIPFLKERAYVQARVLDSATSIYVCSAAARTVTVSFKHAPLQRPRSVEVLDPSSASHLVVFGDKGQVSTMSLALSPGENLIQIKPIVGGEKIEVLNFKIAIRSPD